MSRSSLDQVPAGDPGAACTLAGRPARPKAEGEPASILPRDGCVRFLSRAFIVDFSLPLFTFIVEKTVGFCWKPSNGVGDGGDDGSSSPRHVDGGEEAVGVAAAARAPTLCARGLRTAPLGGVPLCEGAAPWLAFDAALSVRLATRTSHRSFADCSCTFMSHWPRKTWSVSWGFSCGCSFSCCCSIARDGTQRKP